MKEDIAMVNANEIERLAYESVRDYVTVTRDKSLYPSAQDFAQHFNIYTVWKCFILGNMKLLISTSLPDGKYYEATYDFGKDSLYLDVYVKIHNAEICNLDEMEINS